MEDLINPERRCSEWRRIQSAADRVMMALGVGALLMKRAIIVARAWALDYLPQGTLGTN
jgi:hypothetical protein